MNRLEIEALMGCVGYPSVTIILPTHREMPAKQQDHVRVKNGINKVKQELLQKMSSQEEFEFLCESLDKIYQALDFSQMTEGLAIFLNNSCSFVYKLHLPVEEFISVQKSFDIRGILYAQSGQLYYWLLALDLKLTRLYRGEGERLTEFTDSEILADGKATFPRTELAIDDTQKMAEGSGDVDSAYHTARSKEFYRFVDAALSKVLLLEKLPVVVVGTEKNRAYFRQVSNNHTHIVGELPGDYVKDPLDKLSKKIVAFFSQQREEHNSQQLKIFEEEINRQAFGIHAVWRMAFEGRVMTLLIEKNFRVFGSINPDNPENIFIYDNQEEHDDLTDMIIKLVLSKQGDVIFFEAGRLKKYDSLAVILRY
jgi:Bacterial archaeo-eukaryotic release factor family 3